MNKLQDVIKLLIVWIGLILACLAWTGLCAQTKHKVQTLRLSNGLQVIAIEDHRSPVVLTSIWYRVGSSDEHGGITGVSHYLEHMLFRGTKRYPGNRFGELIYENGGTSNAFTTADFTVYHESMPSNQLKLALALEADRMQHLILNQKLLDNEKKVIMEERRMRVEDNPQSLAYERFKAAAFINSPYHHPVIGWMTDIEHLQLADLKQWYQRYYVPNNAALIVVGDINSKAVFDLAKHDFGPIPARPLPIRKPREEVAALGKRSLDLFLPGVTQPYLVLGYSVPSVTKVAKRWQPYALLVLSGLLGGNNSARMIDQLVRGRSVASGLWTSYSPFHLYSTLFTIAAVPAKGVSLSDLSGTVLKYLAELPKHPFTKEDIQRVKAQLVSSYVFDQDSLMGQAFKVGVPLMMNQPMLDYHAWSERIWSVTLDQVNQMIQTVLLSNQLTVLNLHPLTPSKELP